MTGPAWWTATLVVLLASTTVTCLGHLVLVRCRRSRAVDTVDVAMGAVMLVMLAGVPLGRGVALASVVGFGLAALVPAVRAVRVVATGASAGVGVSGDAATARQGVLCGAMVVMLVPLVVAAPGGMTGAMTGHTAMAGTGSDAAGLIVAAALTVVAVLGVGALDLVSLVRSASRRPRPAAVRTACRLAMAVTSVWMLVPLIG